MSHDRQLRFKSPLWLCDGRGAMRSPLAWEIVQNAKVMAADEAVEPDVLDKDWAPAVPPLGTLLGNPTPTSWPGLLTELVDHAHDLLAEDPILETASAPARIFGDLHGQFRDFLALLQDFGFPHELGPMYVFNGDWVDR